MFIHGTCHVHAWARTRFVFGIAAVEIRTNVKHNAEAAVCPQRSCTKRRVKLAMQLDKSEGKPAPRACRASFETTP